MKALRRAGVAVTVVPEWEFVPVKWRSLTMRVAARLLRDRAVREFNAELVRQAERSRPDLALVFKGTFVLAESLRRLRALGIRAYCFYPDVSFRTHGPWIPAALPEYDWIFTTKTFGLADLADQLGVRRASLLHHAFDPDLHRPIALAPRDIARFGCDLSFIGTWSPKKASLLANLVERRPDLDVRIWGESWDRAGRGRRVVRAIQGHELLGEDYVRAVQASRINLGLLSERRFGATAGDSITSRTFHIPACGGFLLHERTSEVLSLFSEEQHLACFADIDELLAQIDRYLVDDHARRVIAEQGHTLVAGRDSWDHRITEILARHAALIAS